ncbi:hypothetical protein K1719_021715 [Acacia pycnantha]|nr:hypothetical protein K1719_021715 [Acacia pycnantha]
MPIPSLLGSMMSLTYLNLSQAGFGGRIPHQISNLSSLLYLDIGGNHFMGSIPQEIGNLSSLIYLDLRGSDQSNMDAFYVGNLQWLGGLYRLQHLDLSFTKLSIASNWLSILHSLPSLSVLHLSYCDFDHRFQPSPFNFSTLAILDLSNSYFYGPSLVPKWIFQFGNLVYLQLSNDNFYGSISLGIQNLTFLQHLDLSKNLFDSWLYNSSHLKLLYLYSNNFWMALFLVTLLET